MMEEKKELSFGARFGYFCLAVAPGVACMVLQLICAMVVMIPMLVVAMMNGTLKQSDMQPDNPVYIEFANKVGPPGVFCYHIVGIIVFGLWYYFSFKKPRPTLKDSFKKLNLVGIVIAIVIGLCACFFANGTVVLDKFFMPDIYEKYVKMAEAAGFGVNWFAIIAAVCMAPIGEEFICRGLSLHYGKKAFGNFWVANIVQALIFGAMHANWVQGIYAFVMGLFMGYLVEKKGSILYGMIFHFAVNFSSSTWVGVVLEKIFPGEVSLPIGCVLTLIPLALCIGILFLDNKRQTA